MPYKRKWVVLALSAAAGLFSGGVRADVLLDTRVSNFGYSLTDLRPDDGLAPGLSLDGNQYTLRATILEGPYTYDHRAYGAASVAKTGNFHDGSPVPRNAAGPKSTASFGISGALAGGDLSIFMSGWARNTWADPIYYSEIELDDSYQALRVAMTVAPHTRVDWSGSLVQEVAQTMGRRGARWEESVAVGYLVVTTEKGELIDQDNNLVSLPRGAVDRRRQQLDIGLSFANDSAAPERIFLDIGLEGHGVSFHPVPEPVSGGLMLCGLGVLAGVLRRRRTVQ